MATIIIKKGKASIPLSDTRDRSLFAQLEDRINAINNVFSDYAATLDKKTSDFIRDNNARAVKDLLAADHTFTSSLRPNLYVDELSRLVIDGKVSSESLRGEKGKDGKDGKTPTLRWEGTTLYVNDIARELRGEKGDRGERGPRGHQGERGEPGPQGAPGADGDKMSQIEFQRRLAANLDWSPNLLFSLPNLGQNGWHTETTFNKNLAANGWLNVWTTLPGWGRMIFYAHASAFATIEVGKSYTLSYELYVYKGATQSDGIGVWPIGLTPHTKGDQWTAEDIGWIEPDGTKHAQNSTRAILRATNGEPTSSPLQKPYKIYRTVTFSGTAANAKLYFGFGNESSTSKQVDVYIGNIKLEQNDKPTPLTAPYETYMRYLTASTVRTASVGKRWALNDDGNQSLRFYNSDGNLCMEMDVAESNDPAIGLSKGDFFMSLFGPSGSTLFVPGRQPRVISAWERWGQTAMRKEVSNASDGKKSSEVFVSPHIYAKLSNETPSEDDPNTKWYENKGMTLANGMYADAPPDRSPMPGSVSVPVYRFSGGKRSLTPHHYRVVKVDEMELPTPGEGVLT